MPSSVTNHSNKRPIDDSPEGDVDLAPQTSLKALRFDDNTNGDSGSKKKTGGSARTGQACDRCKIRKIRCDARPGGCSPCMLNNTECKTTDRITGRATSRGHTEHIENENTQLKMYMVELQQQLRDQGVEPKQPPALHVYGSPHTPYWTSSASWGEGAYNNSSSAPAVASRSRVELRASTAATLLPEFRAGCIGDNYLGVSSENNWLSPIEGTSLALFGSKIDLAEFMPSDSDPTTSGLSYRTFLNHAFGRNQTFRPDYPPYDQCKIYSEWYFRSIQPFVPILDRSSFMRLLDNIFHQNYQPRAAETVMVHMVLAMINFQFAARNSNEQARQDSLSHYHYACSFIPDLITGHTLEDIQALTLICMQLRTHPRPGAAWMFTNTVMGVAIESGLHRSAKAWQKIGDEQDNRHHLEMRKRTFWSLLVLHVHTSGKLGRPMPLRLEDFDIEMPEAVPDTLPGEMAGKSKGACSFRAGLEGFKLIKIMMQVYSTIYSVRSTGQYEASVRQFERELDDFVAQLPPEFQDGSQTKDEHRVMAYYLEMSVAGCQILLHHPSLCTSASPQLMTANLDSCLHWSERLRHAAHALKDLKSLDTTWFYSTDFLAAMFTTLFAYTERRDQMTSQDLQKLRQDMDLWIEIMSEVSFLMGLTPGLIAAIQGIVESSIGNIQRHLAAKTASAAVASSSPKNREQIQNPPVYGNGYGVEYTVNGHSNGETNGTHAYSKPDHSHAYSSGQYAYAAAETNGLYPNQSNVSAYDTSSFHGEDSKPSLDAALVAHAALNHQAAPAAANFGIAAFHSPTQPTNGFHPNTATSHPQYGPAAWRHFADSMMTNTGGQEFMHSAGALMALSGKPADGQEMTMTAAASSMGNHNLHVPANQVWPLIHYHNGV